jgi:hypothetical protein
VVDNIPGRLQTIKKKEKGKRRRRETEREREREKSVEKTSRRGEKRQK